MLISVVVATAAFLTSSPGLSSVETHNFFWRGQFAGFIVSGQFSYDQADIPPNGIVREEHLLALDVSFFDPQGTHLRTYTDNHQQPVDSSGRPYVNFAFDTISQELLQDGTFDVDDDENRYRNGFVLGEGDPAKRYNNGAQSGLAFWSRPADNKTPHLHVDDWNNASGAGEFGYPIGYSSHEDASFAYATTSDKIAGGKVGSAYYESGGGVVIRNTLASDVAAYGQAVRVVRALAPSRVETHNFFWRGQFAGFIVSGHFSYNQAPIPNPNHLTIGPRPSSTPNQVTAFDPQPYL